MQALIFIQKLKQTLATIENGNDNSIFFVQPDYQLLQEAKAYAVSKLRFIARDMRDMRFFAEDLLSRDIFSLRLKYCVIKLKELSVEEKAYLDYIKKGLDFFINGKSPNSFDLPSPSTIDDLIALEISKCFQSWYRPEDVFLIDFAEDRQLIFRNPQKKNWAVSNVGGYVLQLSPFETIAFLVALEVVLTLRFHQGKFTSKETLEHLLEGKSIRRRPYSLSLFGIVTEERSSASVVTDFGRKVLLYVKSNLVTFRDIILFLLESEAIGLKYPEETDMEDFLKMVEASSVLVNDQKTSTKTSISLYKTGNYIDSLRVIYPVMEGVLDSALRAIGCDPTSFSGMQPKTEKLAKESLISTKVSTNLEIFSSRNKVLHGNILENDPELMRPLFLLVLAHLKLLVIELDKSISSIIARRSSD